MKLEKYSIGIGDRFGLQGEAQLHALEKAHQSGIDVVPVWNKSHREHVITGTLPDSVRKEAEAATIARKWSNSYYVDADHISLGTVDSYILSSDFFTIDVAAYIGKSPDPDDVKGFVERHSEYIGSIKIPGIDEPLDVTAARMEKIANKFLSSVHEAGKIFRRIANQRKDNNYIIEISMDETNASQTPIELFFILSAIANERIPIQTIAPKFSGRFNKGVDYVGDVKKFEQEFNHDLAVIAYAISEFGLPENLKLSVHSGSDKFSIYEPLRRTLRSTDVGLHIKTAGTTWLEELIGLALSGPKGLALVKDVYKQSLGRFTELTEPYAAVIDIDQSKLPDFDSVSEWTSEQFAAVIRHIPNNPAFNPNVRQLLHVGYKVAAEMGDSYLTALRSNADIIAENVTENILDRHILRIFSVSA